MNLVNERDHRHRYWQIFINQRHEKGCAKEGSSELLEFSSVEREDWGDWWRPEDEYHEEGWPCTSGFILRNIWTDGGRVGVDIGHPIATGL